MHIHECTVEGAKQLNKPFTAVIQHYRRIDAGAIKTKQSKVIFAYCLTESSKVSRSKYIGQ